MIPVSISETLKNKFTRINLGCILCSVVVHPSNNDLSNKIEDLTINKRKHNDLTDINKIPMILSTRKAYKVLGKDPGRYRPSAEALHRRIVQGKDLYKINNVVDLLNLVSLESGYSIGGYDAGKINGPILFDVGKTGEPYNAIGRGILNIEDLPVFRDTKGPFGSPTSDSERTMVNDHTETFLMIIIDFGNDRFLKNTLNTSINYLNLYAKASDIQTEIVTSV
jgi:DNA/RNA-binding domain of Phe-tRNA-synthetase-like protein